MEHLAHGERSLFRELEDALDPERVAPLLRGRFGSPYRFCEVCESTQLLFSEHDPEGAVVVADEQTAGRGRRGRHWKAPPARALLFSVLLRPPRLDLAPQLSLVGGLAVTLVVESALAQPVQLKWPNDVLVGGQKVAGVLAEGRVGAIVLGVGLNVNQGPGELPLDARTPATSLRLVAGREHDRRELLVALLAELELAYERWLDGGLAAMHGELAARDFLAGRVVTMGDIRGVAAGIAPDGRLLVECDGETLAVTSGEVELVEHRP